MLTKVIDFLTPFKVYLLGGMVLLLAVSSIGWFMTSKSLDVEKQLRKTDKVTYEKAQTEYELKALKKLNEREKKYEELAKTSDERTAALKSEYARNLVRFKAAQSRVGNSASGSENSNTEVPLRPSEGSELLIPEADALICLENTARLTSAREWALSLDTVK